MIVHADQVSREEFLSGVGSQLSGPLPPSERDFEVFERVVAQGASTRAAAKEFGLSQTRIVQVRDRVAEWIAAEVPFAERLLPRQRLRLAASIASQRIDYLYSLALEAWRASQGEQTVVREGESGLSRVTRASHGDPKYLLLASRLALRQMDVAEREARGQKAGDRSQEAGNRSQEAGDEGQEAGAAEIYESDSVDPPVRDCSASAQALPVVTPSLIVAEDTSRCAHELSDEIESRRRAFLAALAEQMSPVQPPEADAKAALENKWEPDATPSLGLTRKERRARRRLLERKLRAK